jgi:hypothetical protein
MNMSIGNIPTNRIDQVDRKLRYDEIANRVRRLAAGKCLHIAFPSKEEFKQYYDHMVERMRDRGIRVSVSKSENNALAVWKRNR